MTPRVILIGCVAQKSATAARACDLYRSSLFAMRRAYAEQTGLPWAILSARLPGVIPPETVIAPYERQIDRLRHGRGEGCPTNATQTELLRQWQDSAEAALRLWVLERFAGDITSRRAPSSGKPPYPPMQEQDAWLRERESALRAVLRSSVVEVHAGRSYVDALREAIARIGSGIAVAAPLAGLGIGQQRAWYVARRVLAADEAEAVPVYSRIDALRIVGRASQIMLEALPAGVSATDVRRYVRVHRRELVDRLTRRGGA